MKYREKQELFARLICEHVLWLFQEGYTVTWGDTFDTDGDGGHMKGTTHNDRMATDLNIFLQGRWLDGLDIGLGGKGTWQIWHWGKIGQAWKMRNPLCAWGGDFSKKDYNHFSLEHMGKR